MVEITGIAPEWGLVCGRISVLEGRLASRDFLLGLIAQEHIDDLVPHLQDTFLRDYLAPGSPWEDFNALTDRCFHELVMNIRSDCPWTEPADLLLLPNDYLNLKNAVGGIDEYPFAAGLVSHELAASAAAGDIADLPSPFKETVASVRNESADVDLASLDLELDAAYFRHMLELATRRGIPLIAAVVRACVLSRAITVLWRTVRLGRSLKQCEQHFLPMGEFTSLLTELLNMPDPKTWPTAVGGDVGEMLAEAMEQKEEDQVWRFGLLVQNYMTRLAKEGQSQVSGPERVFSFLIALFGEVQNLKLVVCGRLGGIDKTLLRQRLRETYG